MVSISKLLTGTLLYTPLNWFNEVAEDALSNKNDYNLARHLFGAGPYFDLPGYGISPDLPTNSSIEQVHIFMRHGERYPTNGSGHSYKEVVDELQSYEGKLVGPLGFLNDYEFYIQDMNNLDLLSTPDNVRSPYIGGVTAMKAGAGVRSRYGELYNENNTLPIFTAAQYRCMQTAEYFTKGFLGINYDESKIQLVLLPENVTAGFNVLTPTDACTNFNTSYNKEYINQFPDDYLHTIADRLMEGNPGLNVTTGEVETLFATCAYEFSNTGSSKFCELFTQDEMITFDYTNSLNKYYTQGPGNPLGNALGYLQLNATLALLKEENPTNKIWASFTHDSDLAHFYNAIGLFDIFEPMPNDRVVFKDSYKYSDPVIMGGRLVTEKFSYEGDSYIRFIVNNAVVPLRACSTGPGFSCKLSDFEGYFNDRFPDFDMTEACGSNTSYPQHLTFYWDYDNNPAYKPDIQIQV